MERFIFKVAGLTGKIENGTVAFQHAGQRSVFGNVLHQFAGHQRDNSFEALLPVIAFCNRTPKYYGRLVIFLLLHCYAIVKIFQFMCPIVALLIPGEGVAFYFLHFDNLLFTQLPLFSGNPFGCSEAMCVS